MTCLLATTATAAPSLMDTLPYLVGMLLVLITLSALWGICAIIAKIIGVISPAPAPAAPKPAAPAPAASKANTAASDRIAPEIVAVIAAAVATVSGRTHRIISIKSQSTTWEKAGRQSVLSSHRIR